MVKLTDKVQQLLRVERKSSKMDYPPTLSDQNLDILISEVKDWQITHGSLLKLVRTDEEHTVLSRSIGCTLFPTLFPQNLFEEALALQSTYNKLYAAIAEDEEWLFETLTDLIAVDPLANVLWSMHEEVKREGYLQDLRLAIFRSDYMLHLSAGNDDARPSDLGLRQVEFNTISCAGGVHANKISDMHRHLEQSGIYEQSIERDDTSAFRLDASYLPKNPTLQTLVSGLASAHKTYGPAKDPTSPGRKTCILFIVQPNNFNIADERPIEYGLHDESIPAFRVTFGQEVLEHTTLTPTGELTYSPPHRNICMEVSVVYFRAGFEVNEYNELGRKARLQLERSKAIKCPSILSHLSTFKKVQQALTLPSALERFLNPEESALISKTFAPQYPLDESKEGIHARNLALNPETARYHVLKPSLEGGGHNIYGEDIIPFLKAQPPENWGRYILMERISAPEPKNFLMSSQGLYEGPVVSELGVFGVCLWKAQAECNSKTKAVMVEELKPCWSLKTKDASIDEMSVVKGYGCFDSPAPVEPDLFLSSLESP